VKNYAVFRNDAQVGTPADTTYTDSGLTVSTTYTYTVKAVDTAGNTSAASVPLALSKLVERGEVPSGAPVLLFGFGGGLTYAGQVVRCP